MLNTRITSASHYDWRAVVWSPIPTCTAVCWVGLNTGLLLYCFYPKGVFYDNVALIVPYLKDEKSSRKYKTKAINKNFLKVLAVHIHKARNFPRDVYGP